MANISSQSTRTSGRTQNYAKKDCVAISAINASVPLFEKRLAEIRAAHGKDGLRPRAVVDEDGRPVRDADGNVVVEKDAKGRTVYEAKYVEAYSLVESFGHDELDPDDPASWTRANELGRAVAEDRFPGHPVLVATEVNGRSGCVHNHLIVGAVHPETGRSIDSNVVTHARLAVEHDRVLAEQGFEQRADMRAKAQAAEQAMADAHSAVLADPDNKDLTPSQLRRRLTAAENAVHLERDAGTSASQARQDRRLREYDRYRLNERDRMIAHDIGAAPPREKFSEIELESRVKDALSDARFQSWDELSDVAREHRVTITPRGEDVSFGMMIAQSDGSLAQPSRAHVRRGGRPGSDKGLGDGLRREDVEAAIERNVREHEQRAAKEAGAHEARDAWHQQRHDAGKQMQDWYDSGAFDAELERLRAAREQATAPSSARAPAAERSQEHQQTAPAQEPRLNQEPVAAADQGSAFRSRIRDARATTANMQERFDQLAPFEERWHGRLPETPEQRREFEQQAAAIGIGPKVLRSVEGRMEPELHAYLSQRAEQAEHARQSAARRKAHLAAREELRARAANDPLDLRGTRADLRENAADIRFETEYFERVRQDREAGVYSSREHERAEHLEEKSRARSGGLERTGVQQKEADAPR